jgi:TIR domain-containing protein/methyltransferase family protein
MFAASGPCRKKVDVEPLLRRIISRSGIVDATLWKKATSTFRLTLSCTQEMSSPSSSPLRLFYSYSHRDEELRVELEKHLSVLRRQGVISGWSDRRIELGKEWAGEIDSQLNAADIVLLLVSADFLSSDYCYDVEMTRAMERHAGGDARIIPIICRPCDWKSAPFGKLQALPTEALPITLWPNADAAFEDIARGIRRISEALLNARLGDVTKEEKPVQVVLETNSAAATVESVSHLPAQETRSRYSNLFQIASWRFPYVVLIAAWKAASNEFGMGEVVSLTDDLSTYVLPQDFKNNPRPTFYFTDFKCRLRQYDFTIIRAGLCRLTFTFSKIEYLDYLLSGEYLDAPLPNDPTRTFRDKYAPRLDLNDLSNATLTNICGVGIFLITRDDKIIVSRHSHSVNVYSNTWTYSASGTMDWSDNIHPFTEMARECREELGHRIKLDNMYLFGFGVDAAKLYYQFSFFERTGLSAEDVIAKAIMARDYYIEMQEVVAIPFELESVIEMLRTNPWEPAAAAGLLTLCAKRFGYRAVERVIDPVFVRKRLTNEMTAEWDDRASRTGDLAVMSARYPSGRRHEESSKYIGAVFDFISSDVDGHDVLEIGAGIGRMSEILVRKAKRLTCIDLSAKMLERNRERLGPFAQKVRYVQTFVQNYSPDRLYEVAISSLMLIHNVEEEDFHAVVEVMKKSARTLFLFEHVDVGQQVSEHTRLRSEEALLSAFHEYKTERRVRYQLFTDNLIFLKLTR